jgi:hypothetical protein
MESCHSSERATQLISILTDTRAREDERDDAAMYLESFSGTLVESALADTIRKEEFETVLAQTCAESLAGIWAREGRINQDLFDELKGPAKNEVIGVLSARAPDLLPS